MAKVTAVTVQARIADPAPQAQGGPVGKGNCVHSNNGEFADTQVCNYKSYIMCVIYVLYIFKYTVEGCGCMEEVFTVRQVCEKYLANGKYVYWTFMDLGNAYDSINRHGMWQMLSVWS